MWEHVIWTGYPLLLLGMFFLPVLSLQGCFSCILWTGFKLAAGLLQRKNVPSQFIAVVCQGMIVVLFMLVILQIRNIFRCRKGKYQCKGTLAVRGGLVMIYLILSVICAVIGILLSILAGTPVGSSIVAADMAAFFISCVAGRMMGRR